MFICVLDYLERWVDVVKREVGLVFVVMKMEWVREVLFLWFFYIKLKKFVLVFLFIYFVY